MNDLTTIVETMNSTLTTLLVNITTTQVAVESTVESTPDPDYLHEVERWKDEFANAHKKFYTALIISVLPFLGAMILILTIFSILRRIFTLKKMYKRKEREKQIRILEELLISVVASKEEREMHEKVLLEHHLNRGGKKSRAPNLNAHVKDYMKQLGINHANQNTNITFMALDDPNKVAEPTPIDKHKLNAAIENITRDFQSLPNASKTTISAKNPIEKEVIGVINEIVNEKLNSSRASVMINKTRSKVGSSIMLRSSALKAAASDNDSIDSFRLKKFSGGAENENDIIFMKFDKQHARNSKVKSSDDEEQQHSANENFADSRKKSKRRKASSFMRFSLKKNSTQNKQLTTHEKQVNSAAAEMAKEMNKEVDKEIKSPQEENILVQASNKASRFTVLKVDDTLNREDTNNDTSTTDKERKNSNESFEANGKGKNNLSFDNKE